MYHLMTVQTSKGNAPHTYKKLIKASAIKVINILQSLEKKKICEEYFEKELLILTGKLVMVSSM